MRPVMLMERVIRRAPGRRASLTQRRGRESIYSGFTAHHPHHLILASLSRPDWRPKPVVPRGRAFFLRYMAGFSHTVREYEILWSGLPSGHVGVGQHRAHHFIYWIWRARAA